MSLVEKLGSASEKTKHYIFSSLLHVGFRGLDMYSTSLVSHKHGTGGELNPIVRGLMENQGIDEGLLIHTIGVTAYCLGSAFVLNKLGERISDNKIIRNLGTFGLYSGSAIGFGVVANNFINYFN